MSTFTCTLGELLESNTPIWDDSATGKYPIFDEEYRETLNRKIQDHYYMWEIGQETVGQFRFALNRKMREIMPLYNKIYESTLHEIDPFRTQMYHETMHHEDTTAETRKDTGTSIDTLTGDESSSRDVSDVTHDTSTTDTQATGGVNQTTHVDATARAVNSDTPQTRLAGNEDYATSATDSTSSTQTNSDTTNTSNTHEETISDSTDTLHELGTAHTNTEAHGSTSNNRQTDETKSGDVIRDINQSKGSMAELLMKYRQSLLNVDMQIIKELEGLFMMIWDNGDEYSANFNSLYMMGGTYYGYRSAGSYGAI